MKIACTINSGKTPKIQEIDLSSAFDTVNRRKLMKVIDSIRLPEDSELVNFLLKDTKLRGKTNEKGLTYCKNFCPTR